MIHNATFSLQCARRFCRREAPLSQRARRLCRQGARLVPLRAGLAVLAIALPTLFISCDKYGDDLRQLGSRVEVLEKRVLEAGEELTALKRIVETVEGQNRVTDVVRNSDGSYTITFANSDPVTLRNGRQGEAGERGDDGTGLELSVAQDADSLYYWTINGAWMVDANGNKLRASAVDGQDGRDGIDGKDGKDGHNGVDGKDGHDGVDGKNGRDGKDGKDGKDDLTSNVPIPIVRINSVTGTWEVSSDGGITWQDTGTPADGQDGKDGKLSIFQNILVTTDGSAVTFILSDGRIFTLPIHKD